MMIGIVFATEKEAEPFLSASGARLISQRPFVHYSGEIGDKSLIILICGMGKVNASMGVQFLIHRYGIFFLINAGICGSLSAKDSGDYLSVFKVSEAIEGELKTIDPMAPALFCNIDGWPDLKVKTLVTNDQPVFDSESKKRFSSLGQLVDMEGAAVLKTGLAFDIPVVLIKGVSDFADEAGRDSLLQNMKILSQKISLELKKGLLLLSFEEKSKKDRSNKDLSLQKILNFTKIEHTSFSLPLLFAGAYMGGNHTMPPLKTLLLILVAAVGARIFGMAFNRIFDRKIDALNPRTANRELPSGKMGIRDAYLIAVSGLLVYLTACFLLGGVCLYLSMLPLVPLLGYSLLKRWTFLCHFGIGICLAIAPLGAFAATAGHIEFTLPTCLFSLFVFLWMSASDIIYALLDIESDRRHRVQSIPAVFGAEMAEKIASRIHFLAVLSLAAMVFTLKAGFIPFVMTGYTAAILSLMYHTEIPIPVRFFPISTLAGISGAMVPMLIC